MHARTYAYALYDAQYTLDYSLCTQVFELSTFM